ncbi:MAG: hypothetical protein ABI640_12985 [Gammaproteobacteria bacterium]
MQIIASSPMRYGRRDLRAGEPFDATDQDARALVLVGLARHSVKVERPAEPEVAETYEVYEEDLKPKRKRRSRKSDELQA